MCSARRPSYLRSAIYWVLFAGICLPALSGVKEPLVLFVATEGNDGWSGTLTSPNENQTDGPFATLLRARDEIRAIRNSQAMPDDGITVVVRGGTYYLDAPLELTAEDSGTESARIVFAAYPGEEVRLSGGRPVKDFSHVTDPDVLACLVDDARTHVYQTNLKKQGISDFGPADGGGLEVFHEDSPLWIARWPNEDFVKIKGLVVEDGHKIHGIPGSKTGKFIYDGDRPKRWVNEKDPWLHGYWFWDWSDQRQQIESIDTDQNIIAIKPPYHGYGYRKGQWYYAFNMLSEIDAPGEYYVDREAGILYVWPPSWLSAGNTVVSVLENLIQIKGASYITVSGFTLEGGRGTAISVEGGTSNLVERCVMRNLGGWGASITGQNHGITACEVYQTGRGGISINGGDRKTLEPGGLYAENNHIHHYGRVFRMYQPGISLHGVGNRLSNNLIHSAPHIGIMFGGNDHIMEYNEIHNVCFESNDAGAIYAGRNWTMRGNIIRYNYMHDVTGFENRGCVGVYLDDMFASAAIYGNVFRNVTAAAFIGGGRDCSIENNIFIDCNPAVHVDARALGWAANHADQWIAESKEKGTISDIDYKAEPYASKYPELPLIMDGEPKAPQGNVIARNIFTGGRWDRIEKKARPYLSIHSNLLDDSPGFVDAEHHDFRLRDDSPAFDLGFEPIPMERIGLFNGGIKGDLALVETLEQLLGTEADAEQQAQQLLGLARDARSQKEYDSADGFYKKADKVLRKNGLPDFDLRIEWGNMLIEAERLSAARKVLGKVTNDADAPPVRRSVAQLQVARTFAFEDKYSAAIKAYAKVKEIPGIPPHHSWEADECIGELERKIAGLPPRDPQATRTQLEPLPAWPGKNLYVSAERGDDANPGTGEKPFASFARAIEEVRRIRQSGMPQYGIRVRFEGGNYSLDAGLVIDEVCSGMKEAPVVFSAEGEEAVFNAGTKISGFAPVADPEINSRLPEEAQGKVFVTDLKKQGITQYGDLITRGFGVPNNNVSSLELYFNGEPMTSARWPNEGFVRTGPVLELGKTGEGKTGRFVFDSPRIQRWKTARDPMMYGYWFYDWADCMVGISEIDFSAHEIKTKHGTNYGFKEGQPFRVFNLLEEIDEPGEWYLDREAGKLYLYPPSDPGEAAIELSMVEEPLLKLTNAKNVVLKGLTFELGRGDGLVVDGGESCKVLACTFRRLGATGIRVNGGNNHIVMASNLHTLGRGGIHITGGDRRTLTPAGHVVENCEVYNFSRIDRTYTPAVFMDGAGIRIAHNSFHNTPCHGMRIEGNDHIVEFNNVYNVVRESDDQGGIDVFLNPTYRGNILRYNFWHDIGGERACGQAGIRLDDAISGTLIYGNVFYRTSAGNFGGVQIHGGKDNWVDNNLFVDCRFAISLSQWSDKRWYEFLDSDNIKGFMDDVKINEPPYCERYPELAHLRDNPSVNHIWRNLAVDSVKFVVRERVKQDKLDNTSTRIDPGFLDLTSGDFGWEANAIGLRSSSFRPIPIEEIGLYEDELRSMVEARK